MLMFYDVLGYSTVQSQANPSRFILKALKWSYLNRSLVSRQCHQQRRTALIVPFENVCGIPHQIYVLLCFHVLIDDFHITLGNCPSKRVEFFEPPWILMVKTTCFSHRIEVWEPFYWRSSWKLMANSMNRRCQAVDVIYCQEMSEFSAIFMVQNGIHRTPRLLVMSKYSLGLTFTIP